MTVRKLEHKYRKIDAPFSDTEYKRFKAFIKKGGFKTGAWVRTVILTAMSQEEAIRANRIQIDYSAFSGNSSSGAPNTAPVNTTSQIDRGAK